MEARASQTMFWPGMTQNIVQTREECDTWPRIAPSQSAEPPTPVPVPDYPFQMVSSDYFMLEGHTWPAGHGVPVQQLDHSVLGQFMHL